MVETFRSYYIGRKTVVSPLGYVIIVSTIRMLEQRTGVYRRYQRDFEFLPKVIDSTQKPEFWMFEEIRQSI